MENYFDRQLLEWQRKLDEDSLEWRRRMAEDSRRDRLFWLTLSCLSAAVAGFVASWLSHR